MIPLARSWYSLHRHGISFAQLEPRLANVDTRVDFPKYLSLFAAYVLKPYIYSVELISEEEPISSNKSNSFQLPRYTSKCMMNMEYCTCLEKPVYMDSPWTYKDAHVANISMYHLGGTPPACPPVILSTELSM